MVTNILMMLTPISPSHHHLVQVGDDIAGSLASTVELGSRVKQQQISYEGTLCH